MCCRAEGDSGRGGPRRLDPDPIPFDDDVLLASVDAPERPPIAQGRGQPGARDKQPARRGEEWPANYVHQDREALGCQRGVRGQTGPDVSPVEDQFT